MGWGDKMEEIRARMSEIEDGRHPSYVKYPLADILIIVMCAVLCGLDTLGDLVIYAKNKKEFLSKEFGIEKIPSKATFGPSVERCQRQGNRRCNFRRSSYAVWCIRGSHRRGRESHMQYIETRQSPQCPSDSQRVYD